jgi:RNA polymerase sigma factor (sigma-70 family)
MSDDGADSPAHRTVEAVWRIESARLIARLARLTREVGLAEDLAQEAFVAALEQWPRTGVPPNPGGWLMTTAKHRAIDGHRRRSTYRQKLDASGIEIESGLRSRTESPAEALDDVGDDLLRLIFTACHPVLTMESRVALTLRCLCGLDTREIARAFLVTESTAAQRLVRAKKALSQEGVRFEMPSPPEMSERLASVLEVVYLLFNEGYSATSGGEWMRLSLCDEAMRLGRVLGGLVPREPEVHGLIALMEIQASRFPARIGRDGRPVLLSDQDRRRWDRLLIRRGLEALARAESLDAPIGPYVIQAGIAACHARAARIEDTDWSRIALLYDALLGLWPTPVVALNRAVAIGMARGAREGLAAIDALISTGALATYPQLHAAQGDLLERLGDRDRARAAFARAAELTGNDQERLLFLNRRDRLT